MASALYILSLLCEFTPHPVLQVYLGWSVMESTLTDTLSVTVAKWACGWRGAPKPSRRTLDCWTTWWVLMVTVFTLHLQQLRAMVDLKYKVRHRIFWQAAGGLAAGVGIKHTLIKECQEEACIPADIAAVAHPVATVRWVYCHHKRSNLRYQHWMDLPTSTVSV